MSELFDKARDAYAKTKSADAKLKLELVAKRLGEVKKKVAESKKKRDAFTQRFRKSLSEPEVKYAWPWSRGKKGVIPIKESPLFYFTQSRQTQSQAGSNLVSVSCGWS